MRLSVKKGPFVSESLIKKVIEMNKKAKRECLNLVKSVHDISGNGRAHYCSPRR